MNRQLAMNPLVSERAYAVFHRDKIKYPPMTLRAGFAVDSYELPPPYDEQLDEPTDDYLQQFAYFALPYLDPLLSVTIYLFSSIMLSVMPRLRLPQNLLFPSREHCHLSVLPTQNLPDCLCSRPNKSRSL